MCSRRLHHPHTRRVRSARAHRLLIAWRLQPDVVPDPRSQAGGGGGGPHKTVTLGPAEATAAELSASLDGARTANTLSFVLDDDGNLSEGPSESTADNTLPRGGAGYVSPSQSPPMSPTTSPSKAFSASSSPRRSGGGSISRSSRSSKKKKGKPPIDRSMISGPSDFIHLEHKNANTVDLAALPPLPVILPPAPAQPELSSERGEPRRSVRRKSAEKAEKPRLERSRPEISAPVGFMHLEHHAAPEEAMFEDDMMLAGSRSSMYVNLLLLFYIYF